MASSSHVKNQKNRVLDPGAAEFSRRRRIFDVRRKSAEKFDLATIRRRRKKNLAAVFGGGVEMSWLSLHK